MARETDKRWKGRLLDWEKIDAMDGEEYEFHLLNQRQVAVLLALLEYQKWTTRWLNLSVSKSELQKFVGDIELRLMTSEDCGMSIDYEAWYDANKRAIYDAVNDVAKQIVSGRVANINVDGTGAVSDPTLEGDDTGGIVDDPATSFDETKAAIYGGGYELIKNIELLLDKVDNYYGSVNGTPVTPADDTKVFIKNYFPTDPTAMDTAIDIYYTYRGLNGKISFTGTLDLIQYMYCNGHDEFAFNQYLIDVVAYPIAKYQVVNSLVIALSDEFWTKYYNRGVKTPSTAYLEASCEPTASEQFTITALATNFQAANAVKDNHRLQITVEGVFTDVDGDFRDFWYYKPVAGIPAYQSGITLTTGGLSPTKPTSSQVPYNTAHKYTFTIDTLNNGALIINIPNTSMGAPITGSISVSIKDLGAISEL